MKPTFRKVYSAPGYWTDPKRLEFWPGPSHDYYSGRWNPAFDFEELYRQAHQIMAARDPQNSTGYFYAVARSTDLPAGQTSAAVSRHKDDILRLPLGASIRADGPELPPG